jgi:hypothetical protein
MTMRKSVCRNGEITLTVVAATPDSKKVSHKITLRGQHEEGILVPSC